VLEWDRVEIAREDEGGAGVVFEGLGTRLRHQRLRLRHLVYRGTSRIRNSLPLGPYSRIKPRALWGGGGSHERGIHVGFPIQGVVYAACHPPRVTASVCHVL